MNKLHKIMLLFLFLLGGTVSALFSADIWIHRFDTSSTINLASTDFWFPTKEWSSNALSGAGTYGDKQIVAVVGIKGSSEETVVEFSSDWNLTSVSDPSLKRPFSVCLIPRVNQTNYPDPNSMNYPKYGYSGLAAATPFTLPRTNGSTTYTDGFSIVEGNGVHEYANVESAWIDVVLVLDPVLSPDGTLPGASTAVCNVAPGDDYLGQMMVTVRSGNQIESTVFYMNGYFGSDYAETVSSAQLVVTPETANTNAFDIVNNYMVPVKIADVDFTTTSAVNAVPNDYYLFVSSSSSIYGPASQFEFKRRGSTSSSNPYNSCTYEIVSTATTGTVPAGAFNGQMVFNGSGSADWMKATRTSYLTGNGRGTIYNTDFHGSLDLKVTGNVDNLLAGAYETDIYVHVITDI